MLEWLERLNALEILGLGVIALGVGALLAGAGDLDTDVGRARVVLAFRGPLSRTAPVPDLAARLFQPLPLDA